MPSTLTTAASISLTGVAASKVLSPRFAYLAGAVGAGLPDRP